MLITGPPGRPGMSIRDKEMAQFNRRISDELNYSGLYLSEKKDVVHLMHRYSNHTLKQD